MEVIIGNQDWILYIGGYKKAGDLLVEHSVAFCQQHILVYPIVFLYRHYIELQLKEIIRIGNILLGTGKHYPSCFPTDHKIGNHWQECRAIIEKIDKDEYHKLRKDEQSKYKNDLNSLQKYIEEFLKLDPDSQASRYPVDRRGNPTILDASLRTINLENIRDLVGEISYLLEGISQGITEYLDAKHQLR